MEGILGTRENIWLPDDVVSNDMRCITQNTKSLKKNTIANFIGLGYTTIIGIVVLPFYLQYLGAEAFGLIGFFIALQAWLQLFDMGTSPMLSRQAAQVCGQRN